VEITEAQREARRRISNAYYYRHREKIQATAKSKYYADHEKTKADSRAAAKAYRDKNLEKKRASEREYYYKNHEKMKALARGYAAKKRKDPNRFERQRKYMNERYRTNPAFRVMVSCRTKLYTLLRRQGRKKSFSLKIEKEALVKHLEAQFLPGMSWDNHGTVWHIDHKIPCIEFDLTDPQQVAQCFSFDNLRPLWAKENLRKNRSILPEFHHLLPKRNQVTDAP